MSIIPQRPPDTPLLQYYSTGYYPKEISYSNFKPGAAAPGEAATINQRNRQPHDEVEIKPITQTKFSSRHYKPDKYLKVEIGNNTINQDVGNNSLHLNKIKNRIKDVEENRKALQTNYEKPVVTYEQAKMVDKSNFENLRNQQLDSKRSNGSMRPSRGKEIVETMLRQATDENAYYKNKKHTFLTGGTEMYSKTMPEYMRTLEKPQNQVEPSSSVGFDGTITIVSKAQGWITVTPKGKNRKKPVEKYGIGGDAAATSKLTPNWMQWQYPKNKTDAMKSVVPSTTNLRQEANRTYLVDKVPPQKSIWSIGDVRHNVLTSEQAQEFNAQAQSNSVVRLMEWNENPSKQKYDKKVSGKIGSYHG